ncbi:amino acid adenylation domain-containing protein [Trinickia sp. NRRL B-1857]|uniref:non-ribosomal peptide synthetase n=1 Tax=Trinickia sp. NRRL B-1857 TaxID=3162879 RepID=UPI003D2AA808
MIRSPWLSEAFPLTTAQREIWLDQLVHGDAPVYKIGGYTEIEGSVDPAQFERAVNLLIEKHDVLRTVLVPSPDEEGMPRQAIVKTMAVIVPVRDFSTSADPRAEACAWAERQLKTPFPLDADEPLYRFELLKLSNANYFFTLNFHHLIVDGWAIGLLVDSLCRIYSALVEGLAVPLVAPSYIEFVERDRGYRTSPQFERQRAYWLDKYRSVPDPLFARRAHEPSEGGTSPSGHHAVKVPRAFFDRIVAFARECGSTPLQVMLAALQIYYARTKQRDEIVVGIPVLNRPNARLKETAGMCVGVSAIRLSFDGSASFEALLHSIGRTLKQDYRYQGFPLSELNRAVELWKSQRVQIFDVSVSYERDNYDLRFAAGRARIRMLSSGYEQMPLMLHIRDNPYDDCAWIHFMYNVAWFDAAEIDATAERLLGLLEQALAQPTRPVAQLAVTTPAERRMLAQWSEAKATFTATETLHERFERIAERMPNAVALTFGDDSLTYAALNDRANRLARRLIGLGVKADDRVAICAERGIEMIVGLLAILKAGGAYVPLDPAYPPERLAWTLEDCAPVAVLVHGSTHEHLRQAPVAVPILDLDDPHDDESSAIQAGNPQAMGVDSSRLAYIIYTSGSTGRPKGVMVEHRNVTRLFDATRAWFRFDDRDVWALFHSFAFDFSVWEIWGALLHGGRLVVVPYLTSRSPTDCYALLCEEAVTVLNQTPSAFRQLIAAQGEHPCAHSLRTVVFGGEALELSMLTPWFERAINADTQLVNMYGITETTVHVTYRPIDPSDVRIDQRNKANSVGIPIPDLEVHVLDAGMQPVPIGVEGELYVGGAGVARGYLNRRELTEARFVRHPFDSGARLYRSGDVGRWLPDGTLEYLGRNDDQVKVRGFRIELGEIEAVLAQAEGVREAIVVAREDSTGDKRLVAYYIGERRDAQTLREHVHSRLPEHMVPGAYVYLEHFPLTPNGKLDRRALPEPSGSTHRSTEYEAPRGEREQALARIWSEVLRVARVGRHDHFFELGGHSLLAVKLIERMRREGLKADVKVLFSQPTLAALAAAVAPENEDEVPDNRIPDACGRITPDMLPLLTLEQSAIDTIAARVPGGYANIQDIYPLAPLQQGILYHHLSAREGDPYLIQVLLGVDSKVRLDALIAALREVVARHDVLRTVVLWEGLDEPVQVVLRHAHLQAEEVAFASGDEHGEPVREQLKARFDPRRIRLDVRRAPLMKIAYARDTDSDAWYAVLLFHHLIDDATSLRLMRREIARIMLGNGQALAPQLAYRRYVAQTRKRSDDEFHAAFFRDMLADVVEPTLPFGIADVRGDGRDVREAKLALSQASSERVRRHAKTLGVSVASLHHLAWARVVGVLSGRDDVVFGTVLMGRLLSGGDVERAMGMFINTLPVRVDLGSVPVRDAAVAVHARLSALLAHEHAPLALAQRCSGVCAPAPLFGALLNFRHGEAESDDPSARLDWDGIDILDFVERTNYPLTMSIDDLGDAFSVTVQAVEGIDAARVCGYVSQTLDSLCDALDTSPNMPAHGLSIVPSNERQTLLEAFNATAVPYPKGETVHGLFEDQAVRTPDAIAIRYEGQDFSYRVLDQRANALAHRLVQAGVVPGDRVAIGVERSAEMVVGLLAILKAGAAYVPLDPAYPESRLKYMLEDSAPAVLLTHSRTVNIFKGASVPALDIGRFGLPDFPPSMSVTTAPVLAGVDAHRLAYIIYTSGSTGRPKGVMNEHHAVVNRLRWMQAALDTQAGDVVLQKTPFSFDVSVWEFFLPLMAGAKLVLARAEGHKDPAYLCDLIEQERVTTAHFVPSMLQAFLETAQASRCASLAHVVCSGEALPGTLLRQFHAALPASKLHNLYGPTEAAVDVTAWVSNGQAHDTTSVERPPIGHPISNTRIYILDAHGQPVPLGIAGEIHIGGVQVARGYWNRPDLTAEKFVDDPFAQTAAARMYRTGDLGRWLPDGSIDYLGRNDDQVKIRGFRIELGEIQTRLAEIEGVREAVVVAGGEKRLVAYVTGAAPSAEVIRASLAERLPEYMVPSAYVLLDALPLTPNGKLDRKALPAPDRAAYRQVRYEPPLEGKEQVLAAIWTSLLNLERIGRHDNFFELGGHSLLLIALIERMRRVGLHADVRLLFSAPTLAELAERVTSGRLSPAIPPNLISPGAARITPAMLTLVDLPQAAIDSIVAGVPGGAANIQDIYPLAPLQEGILYHHLSTTTGDPYLLYGMFAFERRALLDDFIAALERVVARHDVLRTGVVWEGLETPVQVVWRHAALKVDEIRFSPSEDDAAAALRLRFDPRHTRLDVRQPPLLRLVFAQDSGGQRWTAMLLFHHLALDHAALAVVQDEIRAHLSDPLAQLPQAVPYREYVAQAKLGVTRSEHEAFFTQMLGDVGEPTLPYGRGEVRGDGSRVAEHSVAVSSSLVARLRTTARTLDVSTAGLVHAAWGRVLSVLSGVADAVVFGTVLFGRFQSASEAGRSVGLFINTLPLRVDAGTVDVRTAVKTTAYRLAGLLAHEHASLALAQRCSGVSAPSPLFGALLNYRHSDAPVASGTAGTMLPGITMIDAHERTNYPLVLSVDDWGDALSLTVQAVDGIEPARVAGYVLTALESLCDALEHAPQTPMRALTIVPANERRELLLEFNATATDYPPHETVHALFARTAARAPDAVAIEYESREYRYRELDRAADALARHLIERGVVPDARVAICIERSPAMIVALLAVMKAGGAYVPMDPSYPPARLRYMVEDSRPVVLLVHAPTSHLFDAMPVQTIEVGDGGLPESVSPCEPCALPGPAAHDLAYVIYTSGSTGQPKGVMVEHRQLLNLVHWHIDTFALTPGDRTAAMAGVGFDAAAWEIWPTLCSGGTLLLPPVATAGDPQRLLDWWCRQRIDVGFLVTPLAELAYATGRANRWVRTLLIGGERLKRPLEGLQPGQVLVNNYGPTEATVVATSSALSAGDSGTKIGRPIANACIYILDADGEPVPIGVAGEIHIGGGQVARGYLDRAELSAAKFVADPFVDSPAARMYRTGDLGRWLPSGEIEYLGRNDEQVKIRGFRVELGEIEAVLSQVDGVREAAVVVRDDVPGEPRIVAYYIGEAERARTLSEIVSRALPRHMVSAAFMPLAALPFTANGKLDRKALPAPETSDAGAQTFVAPETGLEQTLAAIWQATLGVERVGRFDNFFELGGHSLLAVSLIDRLRRAGLNTDVRTLFAAPTLAALAQDIESGQSGRSSQEALITPPNSIPEGVQRITPDMLTLVTLTERDIDAIVAGVPGGARNVQDIYPLLPLQEGVLYHHLTADEGEAYLLRARLTFDDRAAIERFSGALQAVIDRHDVLRTAIAWEGLSEPVQVVYRQARLPVHEVSLEPGDGDLHAQLAERVDPQRYRLDLGVAPPIQLHIAHDALRGRWVAVLLFHHIALDHAGVEVLLNEVQAHLLGRGQSLALPTPFREYVARARLDAQENDHEAFFRKMLSDVDEPTLPYGLVNVSNGGEPISQARHRLSGELSDRLRQASRRLGISAASVFHLAWARVLGQLSGREDVVFGTVLLGRWQANADVDRALGLFINTLPIRIRTEASGVRDALQLTHRALSDLLGHEYASLALAQRCSGVASPMPLFSALLNFRHSAGRDDATRMDRHAWDGIDILDGEERTNYPCALSVDDLGDAFELTAQIAGGHEAMRLCGYVEQVLRRLADVLDARPDTSMGELSILSDEERTELLIGWNATERAFPGDEAVHAVFERIAVRQPDAPAVVDGEATLTYAQLNRRADQLANTLIGLGTRPGERMALLLDRSAALIVAQLAVLKCGATYVPLDRNAPVQRQGYMLSDCGATRVLTQAGFAVPEQAGIERVDLDRIADAEPQDGDAAHLEPAHGQARAPAYIMYTSGSTGQPKGVVIPHRGINRLAVNNGYAAFDASDRIAFTSNPAFDASTMEVWGALLNGACLVIVPHETLLSPQDLAALLHARRVTALHLVAGLLSAYVDALATVFPTLRYLLTGGDAADVRSIQRILRDSPPARLIHCYGPTESTTFATTYALRAEDAGDSIVPIGRPISNTRVYLLDTSGCPVPVGVAGEIYIGGDGVALGYLNRDDLTAERFVPDPFSPVANARMYRTGDLGRYRADGNIEYLGRNDAQVKIRGFRVEPGEVQAQLAQRGLGDAIVVAHTDAAGEKRLVAYYVGDTCDVEALTIDLRASLPDYMVPSAFVALDRMPVTLNGKVDRRALPAPRFDADRGVAYEAPVGEAEQALAQVWSDLLDVPRVGRRDNFFTLGGHSLLAVRAIGRLRRLFGDAATLRALFETEDLAAFAARLGTVGGDGPSPLGVVRSGPLPLSFMQERLWLIQQRDGGNAYNMHGALAFDGPLSLPALRAAVDALVARHEPLRTRFHYDAQAGMPVQIVDTPEPVHVDIVDVGEDEVAAALARHAGATFDLEHGSPFTVVVLRVAPSRHIVSLSMHHIVSDGWSLSVLIGDLRTLYATHRSGPGAFAGALPPLPIQYADYASRQRRRDLHRERAYWKATLQGYSEPTDIAVDGAGGGTRHGSLGQVRRRLPPALARSVSDLSGTWRTGIFTLFLVTLAIACKRRTGREDLCIGTTTAGRDEPELETLVGFFVNILPLRLDLSGDPTGLELIEQARGVVLGALEHQALPFEQMLALVPELRQPDGASPVPIVLRHQTVPPLARDDWDEGLKLDVLPQTFERMAQSALDLEIFGQQGDVELVANFDSARFAAQEVELLVEVWLDLLARLAESPDARLSTLTQLTPAEHRFLECARGPSREYEGAGIVELFARQVARRPDAPACWFEGERTTYAQLDRRADAIAHTLHRRGIGPGARVALHLPRSGDFLASILACFKLNCAYVPIDPAYPPAYTGRMLDDAQPSLVVTTPDVAASHGQTAVPSLVLEAQRSACDTAPFDMRPARRSDIAYIAYTSGSTGEPKGVVVEHRQVLNCLHALWERTPYDADEIVGQKTSMSFVPSVKEMLSGLLAGIPQVILPDIVVKDAPAFAQAILDRHITRLNLVPSHLAVLLDYADKLTSLRHVTTAGEPLSRLLRERFARCLPWARLHNNYGCSELNDITYASECASASAGNAAVIEAGRPIANTRVQLLDDSLNPVAVGAVGKIFVEGASVGPGYWRRPELTAERFVEQGDGIRMMGTGDLGRWLPDGQLLHLGREDFQIKVRGQRVELPAIEHALGIHSEVAAAAATGREIDGVTRLIAFCVPRPGAHIDANALHDWLLERLPSHLVPSRFIEIEAMPCLPNGKLNRRALASMEIGEIATRADEAAQAAQSPQGPIECLIASQWCEALGVSRVGRHDNFFALGGDSLMAAKVMARVSEALQIRLTVRSLFETRTVHALASLAQRERARKDGSPSGNEGAVADVDFVAFNSAGRQRPLFLMHTLQGYSWYFGHLAAHIDADIPVYGLPPTRLGVEPPRTMQAIAARFIGIMKSLEPSGPYRIAGWSFGGLIAYEIATQLIAGGDDVEFLGLFDTTLPAPGTEVDLHRAAVLTLYSFAVNNFTGFDPDTIGFESASGIDELIARLVDAIERRRGTSNPLWHLAYDSAEENRQFLERLVTHGLAMNRWRPARVETHATVFAAEDASITPLEGHAALPALLGWEAVLDASNLERVPVPGNHETIVKLHADVLGRAIVERLAIGSVIE